MSHHEEKTLSNQYNHYNHYNQRLEPDRTTI